MYFAEIPHSEEWWFMCLFLDGIYLFIKLFIVTWCKAWIQPKKERRKLPPPLSHLTLPWPRMLLSNKVFPEYGTLLTFTFPPLATIDSRLQFFSASTIFLRYGIVSLNQLYFAMYSFNILQRACRSMARAFKVSATDTL